jgi:hypothetical protein
MALTPTRSLALRGPPTLTLPTRGDGKVYRAAISPSPSWARDGLGVSPPRDGQRSSTPSPSMGEEWGGGDALRFAADVTGGGA